MGFMNGLFLLIIVIVSAGCMQLQMLPYLDQALVLQDFSNEKDGQQKFVNNTNATFDKLLAEVQNGMIKNYKTQEDVRKAFGPPIIAKDITADGQPLKQWMYRYAIQSKAKQKVYLFFNAQGRLMHWETL